MVYTISLVSNLSSQRESIVIGGGQVDHIIVVDHPVVAEGVALLLREHRAVPVSVSRDPSELASGKALVLIELFLPAGRCGWSLARALQQSRPDLIPVIWAANPASFYIWAAQEYQLPGFLDKTLPVIELLWWFDVATRVGSAWPGHLLARARVWEQQAAVRLQALPEEHWRLWFGLVRGESNAELAVHLGWSRRTVERRLGGLYSSLGVQHRVEAVAVAWQWGLVKVGAGGPEWGPVVRDLFPIPS